MRLLLIAMLAVLTLLSAGVQAASNPREALHALDRLSYGPAPGDLEHVLKIGVQAYIAEQLNPEKIEESEALLAQLAELDTLSRTPADLFTKLSWPALKKVANQPDEVRKLQQEQDRVRLQAAQARLLHALYSPAQLRELMVEFWFNHFNVFADRSQETRLWVWSYERDAIRPYALGKFRDLLGATAHHPAMLFYLDNWLSKAPGSPGGGLNENYARELMELHTLGVDGGYTQDDVVALARILSGWTYRPHDLERGVDPAFYFDAATHDRGAKQFLGRYFGPDGGLQEGEQALDMLAASPQTARHIAYQLAQYFVADQPPPNLVRKLAWRFETSKGDIREVLATLFASSEFWDAQNTGNKFKTPLQYLLSSLRASGLPPVQDVRPLLNVLQSSGQPLYGCLTPDGYAHTREAWFNPDALLYRLNFASAFGLGLVPLWKGEALGSKPDAFIVQASQGQRFSLNTLESLADAHEQLRAGMLLASPEFMRR
ncbi:Uncharacterized conserved protein, DUF1800 family [Solimonas aquatica]|uniref:Uncharacterized conserved protein, DUF1800 family n=1 Tax=Solimonas aquatica TaxID=489703 RepID=A0A1H8ZXV0_9GAMM|nr:DUF1800 domain-containing protein [Solimonas aquatica]SEP69155.1 Uncharacterized conserved protein, DUF1800 family [Solimonas aquatica]